MFLHTDSVKTPLEPPYCGPYKVLSKTDKNVVLFINNKRESVAIDRCKPAYIEDMGPGDSDPLAGPTDHEIYQDGVASRERRRKIKLPVRFRE